MKTRMLLVIGLLWLTSCRTTQSSDVQIIGGSLFVDMPEVGILTRNGEMHCTATLIRPNRIVTAAHCVDPKLYNSSIFAFGSGPDRASARLVEIARVVAHPLYDAGNNNYDIAYADLKDDSPMKPVTVFQGNYDRLKSESLLLVGYGAAESRNRQATGSGTKRSVSMKVVEVGTSKLRFEEPGKSACSGDSGGPAFVKIKEGVYELAAVTSCGAEDCKSYGVYTRLDPFLGFLGLTERQDQAMELPVCGKFLGQAQCDGAELVSCQKDCFGPTFTREACDADPSLNLARCAADSHRPRCIDESYRLQTLAFKKVSHSKDKGFTTEPFKAQGVFIDRGDAKNSIYGATDNEGVFRDYLRDGSHTLDLRRGDRSYTAASAASFESGDQAVEFWLGDTPVQITVTGILEPGYSLYITGAGPFFRNWSDARRLTQRGDAWVYEDALARTMEYKVIKLQNSLELIAAESAIWQEGDKRVIPDRAPSFPEGWLKIAIPLSEIREF